MSALLAASPGSLASQLNWVDFVFIAILAYSVITGYWIGFLAEVVSLVGVIAGVVAAGALYTDAGNLLGLLGVPRGVHDCLGFILVFLVVSLIFRVASIRVLRASRRAIQGLSNRAAGALIGLLIGGMLCMLALVTVSYFRMDGLMQPMHHARLAQDSTRWLGEFVRLLPNKMHQLPGFLGSAQSEPLSHAYALDSL
jgi:membrane protein required for colicin V production